MGTPTRTAIIAAMQQELAGVLAAVPGAQRQRFGSHDVWLGRWHGHEVALAVSGIGKVAAAQAATLLAACCGARRVLLAGTAGALDAALDVGDVVVARAFVQHDMDASPLFPRFEVPLTGRSRFATDALLSYALAQAVRAVLPPHGAAAGARRLHEGLVASGDRFVAGSAERAALKAALPDALAAEMEGGAIAQVCCDFSVPFAALRVISDRADASASVDFGYFLEHVASSSILAVLDALLRTLPLA